MSELVLAEKVRHFYFCLIVALRIRSNHTIKPHENHIRRFLIDWLRRAKSEKRFCPAVLSEIDGLIKDMTGVSMRGIHTRFMRIYSEIGRLIDEASPLEVYF
ncbi:hypothetical protein [Pantoea vagans]|uniref:hypothetical protein n=1 Tax=Pantoea vagans TaxID=470934 RepID=UPI003017E979